jgi:hypothetical protein
MSASPAKSQVWRASAVGVQVLPADELREAVMASSKQRSSMQKALSPSSSIANGDPAFVDAGQRPGLEVWRIEALKPTAAKPNGKLYTGDAYIILQTQQKKGHSSLSWDIYFWLGEESSLDEQGIAAYKTVELDERLGGAPVQHREVQGHESAQFLQCFKVIEYLDGGVSSGFKKVERGIYETRLLHLKGSRTVRVTRVPLSTYSLNEGDCFLLDAGLHLMQWNGRSSNRKERAKALQVGTAIKDDERGGDASLSVFEQGAEPDEFWQALGGRAQVPIAGSTDDEPPSDGGAASKGVPRLLRLSDTTGTMVCEEVCAGGLKRSMLSSKVRQTKPHCTLPIASP